MEIRPIDLKVVDKHASNIYEAVMVSAKRARQLNDDNRQEYNTIISSMPPGTEDEFDDKENPDQLRISLEFEKRDKPHILATKELLDGKVGYFFRDNQ
jgi:DNA-directed RNA polymerase subunit K/omega